jgi:hypothetical protein
LNNKECLKYGKIKEGILFLYLIQTRESLI